MRNRGTASRVMRLGVCIWGLILASVAGGCGVNKTVHYKIDAKYSVTDPQFAQTMGNLLGPALVPGNTVQTLRNGDQIFPAMLEAIRGAQKTITFETYIYWSGAMGKAFTDALSERARAGVSVHLLIDWLGSDKVDHAHLKQMKEAGVHLKMFHPLHFYNVFSIGDVDHRTHRKLLIIDGKVGFTGGVGIADVWQGNADAPDHWRDSHYRIEGPAVAQLQAAFLDNWMKTTGEVLHDGDYFPALTPKGEEFAQVFKSSSEGGSQSMQLMFLMSIAAAGKTVRMESAYFVPDALTRESLIDARKRGASVEIIVPGPKIDTKIVRRASRARWGDLLKEGVKIYEYQPTMFHCKLMIIDGAWVSLGSSNMDNRSFRLNDEANLNVLDAKFGAEQVRMFEEDKAAAHEITYEMWQHRPFREKVAEHLASLLGWEL